MNNDPDARNSAIEREWQMQERAMREEHLGLPASTDGNSCMLRYRLLARALRQPLPDSLPLDFAHRIAVMAEAQSRRKILSKASVQFGLFCAMVIVFGFTTLIATELYGIDWLQLMRPIMRAHEAENHWLLLFAACFCLSTMMHRRIGGREVGYSA